MGNIGAASGAWDEGTKCSTAVELRICINWLAADASQDARSGVDLVATFGSYSGSSNSDDSREACKAQRAFEYQTITARPTLRNARFRLGATICRAHAARLCQVSQVRVKSLQRHHSHVQSTKSRSDAQLQHHRTTRSQAATKEHHGSHLLAHSSLLTIEESAGVAAPHPGQHLTNSDAVRVSWGHD